MIKVLATWAIIIAMTVIASFASARIWGGKPEKIDVPRDLKIEREMTIAEFGKANSIPSEVLQKVFMLPGEQELSKTVSSVGLSDEAISDGVAVQMALYAEHSTKNWKKVFPKFLLWIAFLLFIFFSMIRGAITAGRRKAYLAVAVIIFGVVLGSDPNPMGTVKDAIALFAQSGAVFPPRMIALCVFLLLVIFANRFICSWGCQLGTLQDLLFRMNRDKTDTKSLLPQFRIRFVISNSIRVLFFSAFTFIAFIWAYDVFEEIDPFKLFNPAELSLIGGAFLFVILLLSLFTYRPWCHLFCPFGLVGWIAERIAIFRIRVNYNKCIGCGKCSASCPSPVMDAILRRDKMVIPDCFACGTCIEVCPVKAISLSKGRRDKPPVGKFDKKEVLSTD